MGISSSGRAFAWYKDGTVTAGSTTSLDDWRSPYYFHTPLGKDPEDIVAMAISKSDKVYTWYADQTRSVGTSSDLDYYKAPTHYSLPPGYTPQDIRGIAITGSDQVRTWFADGTVASGSSTNLGASFSGFSYHVAGDRYGSALLGIAHSKTDSTVVSWYRDGYVATGSLLDLGGYGEPFSQHITLYSFVAGLETTEPGAPTFEGPGPVEVVRTDAGDVHEAVLAPGTVNVAVARGGLRVFRKTGEQIMSSSATGMWGAFMSGGTDPVINLNTFTGLGDCMTGYPQTEYGQGFCIFQAYDTRAAYDPIGKRFVFAANARNYVWESTDGPRGTCSRYIDESGDSTPSSKYCDAARRHLLIAVSVSEDPADGFHIYAIKEPNYRDWPMLTVNGNQLIVGHSGGENPDGYAAIVFDLSMMRNGEARPRYFRLDSSDLDGDTNLRFPRTQEGSVLTVAVGSSGRVFGFSRFLEGYATPPIMKTTETITSSINWVLSNGALRLARRVSGTPSNAGQLYYARYPIATSFTGISLTTDAASGAVPYGPLAVPASDYVSFDCPRLAVTDQGDEVIAFAGARAVGDYVRYDAAYVARPAGSANFTTPAPYKAGSFVDPTSDSDLSSLTFDTAGCDQQGGAARDPVSRRVWMMHSYGLEPASTKLVFRHALGWIGF